MIKRSSALKILQNPTLQNVSDKKILYPLLFVIFFGLLILRRPDAILNAQPFAEDGALFIQDALLNPSHNIFVPYSDYLQIAHRLVSDFSVLIAGPALAPYIMNSLVIATMSLCAVYFSSKNFRFIIKNDLLRIICSLFIILVPANPFSFEVYTLANLQTPLALFSVFFSFYLLFNYEEYRNKTKLMKVIYCLFYSIISLTAPTAFILIPIFTFVIIRELIKNNKEIKNIISFGIPTVILYFHAILFYFIRTSPFNTNPLNQGIISSEIVAKAIVNEFTILFARIIFSKTFELTSSLGTLTYVIPIIFVSFIFLTSKNKFNKIDIFLIFFITVLISFTMITRPPIANQYHSLPVGYTGERYIWIPLILLFIIIMKQFEKRDAVLLQLILIVLICTVAYNVATNFSFISFPNLEYQNFIKTYYNPKGTDLCHFPIMPPYWEMAIPCSDPLPDWSKLNPINGQGKITISAVNWQQYDGKNPFVIHMPINTQRQNTKQINNPVEVVVDGSLVNESVNNTRIYLIFSNNNSMTIIPTYKFLAYPVKDVYVPSDYHLTGFRAHSALMNGCYNVTARIVEDKNYYDTNDPKTICYEFGNQQSAIIFSHKPE